MGTYNYLDIRFFILLNILIIFLFFIVFFTVYNLKYDYLAIYFALTIIIIIFSFIKKRTKNDVYKIIRLTNFFWVIPAKIFIIFFGISMFIKGLGKLFLQIFKPKPNEKFPPYVLYILDYGVFALMFIYALFGQELITLFIIFLVVSSILSYSLGEKSLGYSLFPYEFKNTPTFEDSKSFIIRVLYIAEWIWNIFLIFCAILGLMITTIPISYMVAFIYRYDLAEFMTK